MGRRAVAALVVLAGIGILAGGEEAAKDYALVAEDSYAHGYVDGYEDCSCGNPSIYPAQGQ